MLPQPLRGGELKTMSLFERLMTMIVILFLFVIPSILILILSGFLATHIGLTGVLWWISLGVFYVVFWLLFTDLFGVERYVF